MKNYNNALEISEERVAAWLDRNLSPEDDALFIEQLSADPHLSEILDSYDDIEVEFESLINDGCDIPAELSFDFQLPVVEPNDLNDDLISHLDSPSGYSDGVDSEDIHETEDLSSEDRDFYNDNEETMTGDFDLF